METRNPSLYSPFYPFQQGNPYTQFVINTSKFRLKNEQEICLISNTGDIVKDIPDDILKNLPPNLKPHFLAKIYYIYNTSVEEVKNLCTSKPEDCQGVHLSKKNTSLGFAIEYSQAGIFGLSKVPIGKGIYKKVYLAVNLETKQMTASAIINLRNTKDKIKTIEKIIMQKNLGDYPEFVKILHFCEYFSKKNPSKEKISLMMEYCNRGSLENFISCKGHLNLTEATSQIIEDLLSALTELERRKIHHRDIKPENILLHEEDGVLRAKLTDFGFAIHTDLEIQKKKRPGNLLYISPEYFKGILCFNAGRNKLKRAQELKQLILEGKCQQQIETANKIVGFTKKAEKLFKRGKTLGSSTKSDVWGVGLIFYIFLSGENFHNDLNSISEICKKLLKMNDRYMAMRLKNFDLNNHFFAKLVFDMLQINPEKRPLAKELLERWKTKIQ